jgi:hypothetical protein
VHAKVCQIRKDPSSSSTHPDVTTISSDNNLSARNVPWASGELGVVIFSDEFAAHAERVIGQVVRATITKELKLDQLAPLQCCPRQTHSV